MFNHYVLLIVILIFFTNCGADSNCCQKVSVDYLDAAVDFIGKAKSNFPSEVNCENNKSANALDCSEYLEMGYKKNGVYVIWPKSRIRDDKPLVVYCDMETDGGGWTLIQRRERIGGEVDDFGKDWKSYKEGFGDIQKEFWLGNDNIFALTNQCLYSARFDMSTRIAFNNETSYAHYDTFWIDDEYNKYTLHIDAYTGDAGDAMAYHQNQKFSAKDEDNDNKPDVHCAAGVRGGWWYKNCYDTNPNGIYRENLIWNTLSEDPKYLQAIEMKIRPRNFKLPDAGLNNTPM